MAVALLVLPLASVGGASASEAPDVCLEFVSAGVGESDMNRLREATSEVIVERSALFPEPTQEWTSNEPQADASPATMRVEIDAGNQTPSSAGAAAACLESGFDWGARFGRDFLSAGANRMLAEAPTTPGIESEVIIEWYPAEARLRTHLEFAGPLDIPNGRCWVDDTLGIDASTGLATASGEQGLKTSLFAEGACRRFFDHLTDGGAGEQAVTLLPAAVALDDGSSLIFVAEAVRVDEDAVSVSGSLERR